MSKLKCYSCGEKGHLAKDCTKKTKGEANELDFPAELNEDDGPLLACVEEETPDRGEKPDTDTKNWLLDSGANIHVVNNKSGLTDLKECSVVINTAGTKKAIKATHKGTLELKTRRGLLRLAEVFVAPVRNNLLSVKKLVQKGFRVEFTTKGGTVFTPKNKVLFQTRTRQGKLWHLSTKLSACEVDTSESTLWHLRLGHPNRKYLAKLLDGSTTREGLKVKIYEEEFCTGCLKGKLPHEVVPKVSQSNQFVPSAPNEKWYLDTVGPLQVQSVNHHRGFLLMTDGFSKYRYCIPYKTKDTVAELAINKFKQLMNLQTVRLKVVHTDSGTEIVNKRLKKFLDDNGVKLELSTPYLPQQNGRSERANRIVLDGARSMLHCAKLPLNLWNFAVKAKTFLLNRTPCKNSGRLLVPYMLFWNKKPSLDRVFVFGAKGFGKRPGKSPKKLSPRAEECIFLGYDDTYPAWLVRWTKDKALGRTRTLRLSETPLVERMRPATLPPVNWNPNPTKTDVSDPGEPDDPDEPDEPEWKRDPIVTRSRSKKLSSHEIFSVEKTVAPRSFF